MGNKIELVGAYGEGNLGDDLLQKIGIMWAKSGSMRCLLDKYNVSQKRKLKVYFGGTQFFSFSDGNAKWYAYYLVKSAVYTVDNFLCKLAGVQTVALFIGVGPFKNRLAQRLARLQLRQCSLVIVRDDKSHAWVKEHLPNAPIALLRDPVFLAREELQLDSPLPGRSGICIVVRDWRPLQGQVEKRLVEVASGFGPHENVIFSTFGKDNNAEYIISQESRDLSLFKYRNYGVENYKEFLASCFSECDVVVSMRFHGAILALLAGRRVVIIDIDPKFDQIKKDFGDLVGVLSPEEISFDAMAREISRLRGLQNYEDRVYKVINSFLNND